MQSFFSLNDDFEKIIKQHAKDVKKIEKIPTGWTNYVFKVKTSKDTFVFRFPRNDFFAVALKKEVGFAKFARLKIRCVKSVNLILREDNGRAFTVHKFIDGKTLTEFYEKLTDKQKERAAVDILRYVKKLQKLRFDKVNTNLLSTFLTGLAAVNGHKDYNFSHIQKLTQQENKELVLVHGDLNPGNVILNSKGKVIAILDYAFFSVSSPYVDISRLCGRLPEDFKYIILDVMIRKRVGGDSIKSIDELISLWSYVEEDYVDYMNRNHKDVQLSFLT